MNNYFVKPSKKKFGMKKVLLVDGQTQKNKCFTVPVIVYKVIFY